jgi:hypothetical protein
VSREWAQNRHLAAETQRAMDARPYHPGVGISGVLVQALGWSQASTETRCTLMPFQAVALTLTQPPYWLTTVPS